MSDCTRLGMGIVAWTARAGVMFLVERVERFLRCVGFGTITSSGGIAVILLEVMWRIIELPSFI